LVEKRKTLTTKAQRHQGKTHREDGEEREEIASLWEASPDADTAEGREKEHFTTEAQRAQRGKDASHKRRGHGGKEWL
jgi:hypothetical protein